MPYKIGKIEGYQVTLQFMKSKDYPFDNDRFYCVIKDDEMNTEIRELLKRVEKPDTFRIELCL